MSPETWLDVGSHALLAFSYLAIPIVLLYLGRRRRSEALPPAVLIVFCAFALAAAAGHLLGIREVWDGTSRLAAGIRAVTAVASVVTVLLLLPILPRFLALRSPLALERMNAALEGANRRLEEEVSHRSRAEEGLRRREHQLAEAQSVASIGSWEWDVLGDRVEWSDELHRIYGVPRQGPLDLAAFLERVHPDDRAALEATVRTAFESGQPFETRHRIVRPDGGVRTLDARGRVHRDAAGAVVRMSGTGQDVTESVAEAGRAAAADRLLARAGAILGSTLDLDEVLQRGADLVVEESAEICLIDLVEPDGAIVPIAIAGARLPIEVSMEQVRAFSRPRGPDHPVAVVIATGEPLLIADLDPETLRRSATSPEHLAMIESLEAGSAVAVPLRAGPTTVGAMTCIRRRGGRPFDERDVAQFVGLGARLGAAIDNARLHAALAESEERYRFLAEVSTDMISRHDADGVVTYVSPAIREIFGWEPADAVGKRVDDFLSAAEDREPLEELRAAAAGTTAPITRVLPLRRRDGARVWGETTIRVLRDEAGLPTGTFAVTRDVTERVVRERRAGLLQWITAAANEAPSALQALSVALDELCRFLEWPVGHAYLPTAGDPDRFESGDLWHGAESFARFREATLRLGIASGEGLPGQALKTGQPVWIEDMGENPEIIRRDAARACGIVTGFAFPVRVGGRVLAVFELYSTGRFARDEGLLQLLDDAGRQLGQVVLRQEAQAELRMRESQLAEAQRIAHIGSWEWDLRSGRTSWSDELYRISGFEVGSELTFERMNGQVHPEDRERVATLARETVETGVPLDFEYRIVRPDGGRRHLHAQGTATTGPDGQPIRIVGVVQDVTERKAAEERLVRARDFHLRLLEDFPAPVWRSNADGFCDFHNRAWLSFTGRTAEQESGDGWASGVHPDDRPALVEAWLRSFAARAPFSFRYRLRRHDGVYRTMADTATPITGLDGEFAGYLGSCVDETDQLEAQAALRRSEEDYRLLAENSSDVILRFTPEGVCTYASAAARVVTGFTPEELVGRAAGEFVHPDDLPRVADTHRSLLHTRAPQSVMCRLLRKDGGWVWVESTGQGVRGAGDRVEAIVAVTRDVTENVRAARAIRLLEQVAAGANEAGSVREAMQGALRVVCEGMGWPAGHVYLPSRTVRGELSPTDIWHLEEPDRLGEFRRATDATRLHVPEGLPARVLETGRPAWIEDLPGAGAGAGDPGGAAVRAALAFPVQVGDDTLAVLEFFSPDSGAPEEDLLEVMENVGAQLGQVVQRQRTEAALRASELRFRALAESASDAIVTADDQNRIVYANEGAHRIFGWKATDLVGRPLTMLMPERFREAHLAGFDRFLRTREASVIGRPIELVGLRRDGTEIPIELSLAWWEGEEGVFFTGIVRDIAERKRTEEALNEKMEELARSNAELGLFTYVASHDLREPLRTVGSNVQLVARRLGPQLDAGVRKSIDFALRGVKRMQDLIDDLLIYSRVGTEGKTFEATDMGRVLADSADVLRVAIDESGATVTAGELPTVQADATQLGQVVQNLLSNAIKFRRPDVAPEVRMTAERQGREWIFSLADNGIGIPDEYADHVFTIFQRLHSDDEYPGTGIGLAVCRKIVERHGGRIWVEPGEGSGSVFKFTLPAR